LMNSDTDLDLVVGSGNNVYVIDNGQLTDGANFAISTITGSGDSVCVTLTGASSTGIAVDSGKDLDGDGNDDLIIGSNATTAYLFYGDGTLASGTISTAASATITPEGSSGSSFINVAFTGDTNGDTTHDLLLGHRAYANGSIYSVGAAYLVFGSGTRLSGAVDLSALASSAALRFVGEYTSDTIGHIIGDAGDFDGDGKHEIMFGAGTGYGVTNANDRKGHMYIIYGSKITSLKGGASAELIVTDANISDGGFVVRGTQQSLYVGQAVGAGDFDNDTYSDVLIDYSGNVLLLKGSQH